MTYRAPSYRFAHCLQAASEMRTHFGAGGGGLGHRGAGTLKCRKTGIPEIRRTMSHL